ncbi:MAG TPA: alpha/beta hydrolase [Candidatus Tumulicola sp.]
MRTAIATLAALLALVAPAQASPLPAGLYDRSGHVLYVGAEHELPDPAANDFFDPNSQRTGALLSTHDLHLRRGLSQERREIPTPQGRLGFSLYYATEEARSTVILIHGNDPETREMGFIIPFFVFNGINVVSYDQRGVGVSTGNWFLNGPAQRAADVAEIYDAVKSDRHVKPEGIGVWGFSNGGWTAPLVTLLRPAAFMILKSAPAESLPSNIDYEVTQEMRRHGATAAATQQALTLWHSVERALDGETAWSSVRERYEADAKRAWFQYSLLPDLGLTFPPPPPLAAGLKRLVSYDPTETLTKVTVPTLALYGMLDQKVDAADSAARLHEYLARAGNRDVTIKRYPLAGHPLTLSNAANGDEAIPERYVPGYPQIMIMWLAKRGFLGGSERRRQ